MHSLADVPANHFGKIRCVLCDLDGTLTEAGMLPARTLKGLEMLSAAGYQSVIVTGRSAGWCDMIARLWPVFAVVGENGAFYFRYVASERQFISYFAETESMRRMHKQELQRIFESLLEKHPSLRLSGDIMYRVSDHAIDCAEDVTPLEGKLIRNIMADIRRAGASVTQSSIHINYWFGKFDKLSMSLEMLQREFGFDREQSKEVVLYLGDSPNDEKMFRFFRMSVGVENVIAYSEQIKHMPCYVCSSKESKGFFEVVQKLVAASRGVS
jgi:hypothetical protein